MTEHQSEKQSQDQMSKQLEDVPNSSLYEERSLPPGVPLSWSKKSQAGVAEKNTDPRTFETT